MSVRVARDRARMWQIGPRISSATGCFYLPLFYFYGPWGSAVYFHDVRTVDAIAM